MIEITVKEHLSRMIEGVSVYMETPKDISGKFIVLQLIDREKTNLIDAATIEISKRGNGRFKPERHHRKDRRGKR